MILIIIHQVVPGAHKKKRSEQSRFTFEIAGKTAIPCMESDYMRVLDNRSAYNTCREAITY